MYTPKTMQMPSTQAAWDFIDQFNFGALVSRSLEGTHLPFVLKREEGGLGTLYGHFARANPHWESIEHQDVLVIFSGPHAYISPQWYDTKPAVPTWNYAAVHAKGRVRLLDPEQTLAFVEGMVVQHDPAAANDQNLMPDDFKQKLLKAIVGFKIEVTHLEGKRKLGQQRSREDQIGVHRNLADSESLESRGLAEYMSLINVGTGHDA